MPTMPCQRKNLLQPIVWPILFFLTASPAIAASFAPGDLLLGGRPAYQTDGFDGFVDQYDANGTFQANLLTRDHGHPRDMITFGSDVIVADQNQLTLIKRDGTTALAAPVFFEDFTCALAASAAGDLYVGALLDGTITKVSPGLASTTRYTVPVENHGVIAMDLEPDQCTMLYSSAGPSIQRYDVCTSRPLPAFARLQTGLVLCIRVLSGGDVLVSSNSGIYRFDRMGHLVGSYLLGKSVNRFSVVPAEGAAWVTLSANIVKIDLESGSFIVGPLPQRNPAPGVGWSAETLLVVGEMRVSQTSVASAIPVLSWLPGVLLIAALSAVGAYRVSGR